MTETAFLAELVERTGCRLLCDISNVHVSAHNLGYDACRYIDEFPGHAIGEMHLGGFEIEDEAGRHSVIIDTHSQPIDGHAWDLYAYAVARFGMRPTLIEWDNAIPALDTLLAEAAKAEAGGHARARAGKRSCARWLKRRRCSAAPSAGGPADASCRLASSRPADPVERLEIYRRHYRESFRRHLRGRFPTLEWLVGTPRMIELADALLQSRPAARAILAEYGSELAIGVVR